MKVVLVNPFFQHEENFRGYMKNIGSILPPLGLTVLAAVLRNENIDVDLVDGYCFNQNLDQLSNMILEKQPTAVGIYSNTSSYYYAHNLFQDLRGKAPDLYLIAGGPHATVIPERVLQETPEIDFVIIGEGEISFPLLLKKIVELDQNDFIVKENQHFVLKQNLASEIDGIAFRFNDPGNPSNLSQLIQSKPRKYIENLDSVPLPAWDLLNIQKYSPSRANYFQLPSFTVLTSRGCPYHCSFCSKPLGDVVRYKSAERVVEEIEILVENYGMREIIFEDDCFTLNKNRLKKIFTLLDEKHIKITWSCLTRVDTIDEDLLKFMKNHGCWRVGYGVESGDPDILMEMHKGFQKQKIIDAFKLTKRIGIGIRAFFILGSVHETKESMKRTIAFAKQLNPDLAQFSFYMPYPGTLDYDYAVEHNLIHPQFYLKEPIPDYHSLEHLIFVPQNLTENEILSTHKKALRTYYFRFAYIWSQLKILKSWDLTKRYFSIMIDLVRTTVFSRKK